MPKTFRAMKKDPANNRPLVGSSTCCLGVRPSDISPDAAGIVKPADKKGMSVAAATAKLKPSMVARVYNGDVFPEGGAAPEHYRIWTNGTGPFVDGHVAASIQLIVDRHPHGILGPDAPMHHTAYSTALAATQPDWTEVVP